MNNRKKLTKYKTKIKGYLVKIILIYVSLEYLQIFSKKKGKKFTYAYILLKLICFEINLVKKINLIHYSPFYCNYSMGLIKYFNINR